jgi:hypothetical protein
MCFPFRFQKNSFRPPGAGNGSNRPPRARPSGESAALHRRRLVGDAGEDHENTFVHGPRARLCKDRAKIWVRVGKGWIRKRFVFSLKGWGERWDLNPRPSVPQTDALPTELRSPLLKITGQSAHFSKLPPARAKFGIAKSVATDPELSRRTPGRPARIHASKNSQMQSKYSRNSSWHAFREGSRERKRSERRESTLATQGWQNAPNGTFFDFAPALTSGLSRAQYSAQRVPVLGSDLQFIGHPSGRK